jgi:hypothetical protein
MLFITGFAQTEPENAKPDGLTQLQNLVDVNALQNGYTMPMRIVGSKSNTSIDIGIDTIRYVRQGETSGIVSFDAHVDLQIPFALEDGKESAKVKFKGKNLTLAGKGSSSRLSLEAGLPPITILKDKISLQLGQNSYVDFTCDGVEAIGLEGAFIFTPGFLIAVSDNPNDTVKATFSVRVADWDDLMFAAEFNHPFKISGGGDFIFDIDDLVVDFSTVTNAPGFVFPTGYQMPFEDANMWTGFALKEITIRPPQEIDKLENNRKFTYRISHMLIDELGLTGSFMAMRAPQNNTGGDTNSGLNFSIDTVGVSITQNRISGGILGGAANVPFLKDKDTDEPLRLGISGSIQYDMAEKKLLYRVSGTMLDAKTFGIPFAKEYASVTLD